MKNLLIISILFFSLLAGSSALKAQALLATQHIVAIDSNFRQVNPLVLGQVSLNIPSNGKVVVHFDGSCIADSGDRIVLAASNNTFYDVNDGNIGVEAATSKSRGRSFSHTRVYTVSAGNQTFYAVGQNFVKISGSGIATLYGAITAEFYPASGSILVADTGFSYTGNVRATSTPVSQVTINNSSPGTVVVRFDGLLFSTPGDLITLAASNTTDWESNKNVGIMAANAAVKSTPFSHTRTYSVTAGANTFYADAQNFIDKNGDGNISVYGSLTAEFFPDGGDVVAGSKVIIADEQNLRLPSAVVFDTLQMNMTTSGTTLVTFDGGAFSTPGDRIILAASNISTWATSAGNIEVTAPYAAPDNTNSFSNTQFYSTVAGSHTYSAVGQNYVTENGDGTAAVYGTLTVKFFPDVTTGIHEVATSPATIEVYPNPAQNQLTVVRINTTDKNGIMELSDLTGKIIQTIPAGFSSKINVDISSLAAGMYIIRMDGAVKKFVKE